MMNINLMTNIKQNLTRLFKIILMYVLVFIVFMVLAVSVRLIPSDLEYAQGYGRVAPDNVRWALMYHGESFATHEIDGCSWFLRDGQRCGLFNYLKNRGKNGDK